MYVGYITKLVQALNSWQHNLLNTKNQVPTVDQILMKDYSINLDLQYAVLVIQCTDLHAEEVRSRTEAAVNRGISMFKLP